MVDRLVNEALLWQTRPSHWVFLSGWFWLLVAALLTPYLVGILALLVIQPLVLAGCYFIQGLYRIMTERLLVTPHRLIWSQGGLAPVWREFYLDRITGLTIHQSLWGRWLGYGDVLIHVGVQSHPLGTCWCQPHCLYHYLHQASLERHDTPTLPS